MSDLFSHLITRFHWAASVSTTETPSTGIDVGDLLDPMVLVTVGAMANTGSDPHEGWTFTLQHSDSADSGFQDVTEHDVVLRPGVTLANGVFATVDAATEDSACYGAAYLKRRRYVRCVATPANSPGATPIAVSVVGRSADRPVSA